MSKVLRVGGTGWVLAMALGTAGVAQAGYVSAVADARAGLYSNQIQKAGSTVIAGKVVEGFSDVRNYAPDSAFFSTSAASAMADYGSLKTMAFGAGSARADIVESDVHAQAHMTDGLVINSTDPHASSGILSRPCKTLGTRMDASFPG